MIVRICANKAVDTSKYYGFYIEELSRPTNAYKYAMYLYAEPKLGSSRSDPKISEYETEQEAQSILDQILNALYRGAMSFDIQQL